MKILPLLTNEKITYSINGNTLKVNNDVINLTKAKKQALGKIEYFILSGDSECLILKVNIDQQYLFVNDNLKSLFNIDIENASIIDLTTIINEINKPLAEQIKERKRRKK